MSRVWKTIPLHNITSQLHWLACRINLFLQGNGVSMFKRGFKNAVPSMQCCFFFFCPGQKAPGQHKRKDAGGHVINISHTTGLLSHLYIPCAFLFLLFSDGLPLFSQTVLPLFYLCTLALFCIS